MKQCRSAVLFVALSTLTGCQSGPTNATVNAKPKLTKEQEEPFMLMALHHNREEAMAHMNSLADITWTKTPEGLRNLECSIAIMEKHNQKYPKTPWKVEGVEVRDQSAGKT